MSEKYAFIDRDGTLIFEPQDSFQIDSLEKLQVLDGAVEGLKKLRELGYKLALVSNQNGVGTPAFPTENFKIPQQEFLRILKEGGVEFDEIFVCPHFASDNCECRKPKLGLLKDFLSKVELDKKNSFMCGDRNTDLQFAANLGIRGVKIPLNGVFEINKILNQLNNEKS